MSTKHSRPVVSEAAEENSGNGISDAIVAEPESIAEQLRRRREASYRLPPLADGRRDPLDVLVSYSSEPLRLFWHELQARGLLTDAITAELLRLANDLRRTA